MSEEIEAVESAEPEVQESQESEIVESSESNEIAASQESSDEGAVEVQAENEQELESEIKEALEEGATEEEVKNMIRQYTLKVNGKEVVKEIDLSDEDAIKRELQMAYAGRGAMQESAELKKLYSQEIERLRSDPFAVLKELDPEFDPLKLSASYIEQVLAENEMTPEEKAEIQRTKEFEEIKAERDRLKKEFEEKERSEKTAALQREIQTDIMSALESDSELVADDETLALVAENLYWASKNGFPDMKAKDVLPTVKKQLRSQFKKATERFKSTSILKEYMGDELLNKLREERLDQMKNQVKNVNNIKQPSAKKEEDKEEKKKIALSSLFR